MGRNNPAEAKGKTERQQTILRLIQEHPISRQEVLLEHLRQLPLCFQPQRKPQPQDAGPI